MKPICLDRPFSPRPLSVSGIPKHNGRANIAGAGPMQTATAHCNSFDFDEWSRLAKTDPAAFEMRRLALIEAYLHRFPPQPQRRLRGVQFRIDMERRRARTPMAGCLKLSAMMWESLLGNRGLKAALDSLLGYTVPRALAAQRDSAPSARILPFRKPAH